MRAGRGADADRLRLLRESGQGGEREDGGKAEFLQRHSCYSLCDAFCGCQAWRMRLLRWRASRSPMLCTAWTRTISTTTTASIISGMKRW